MIDRSRLYITAVFLAGVCLTLSVKEVYPYIRRHYRRRRKSGIEQDIKGLEILEEEDEMSDSSSSGMRKSQPPPIVEGIEGCIGNTPLFKIKSLSEVTGCEILAKAEVGVLSNLVVFALSNVWCSSLMVREAVPRTVWP